jgi:hypothetical protein
MPEPPRQPKNAGSAVRPLWVIAISLATIAICLVLLVIKQHFDKIETKPVAKSDDTLYRPIQRDSSVERISPKRAIDTSLRSTESITEVVPVAVPVPVVAGATPTFPPERPGGGVIPPLTASATSNSITAISGRVTLHGRPPADAQFYVVNDPSAKPQDPARKTSNFLISPDGGLANVFVTINDFSIKGGFKPSTAKHKIAFAQDQIQPFSSAAMVNQRFVIRNADDHAHRLTIALPDMAPFMEIPLSSKSEVPTGDFVRSPKEFMRLQCKLHPWETGYLTLTDHPFFSMSDTNGNFVIATVPPGKYTISASHPKIHGTNSVTQEVVVNANEITQVSLTLDAPKENRSSDRIQARVTNP